MDFAEVDVVVDIVEWYVVVIDVVIVDVDVVVGDVVVVDDDVVDVILVIVPQLVVGVFPEVMSKHGTQSNPPTETITL